MPPKKKARAPEAEAKKEAGSSGDPGPSNRKDNETNGETKGHTPSEQVPAKRPRRKIPEEVETKDETPSEQVPDKRPRRKIPEEGPTKDTSSEQVPARRPRKKIPEEVETKEDAVSEPVPAKNPRKKPAEESETKGNTVSEPVLAKKPRKKPAEESETKGNTVSEPVPAKNPRKKPAEKGETKEDSAFEPVPAKNPRKKPAEKVETKGDSVSEPVPAKNSRKKPVEKGETKEDTVFEPVSTKNSRKKPAEEDSKKVTVKRGAKHRSETDLEIETVNEPKTTSKEKVSATEPENQIVTKWEEINFTCTKKSQTGGPPNMNITSWNINGLRSWLKKDGLKILEYSSIDVLCLQETKCTASQIPEEIESLKDYHKYWCSSKKPGYAGVGILTKKLPIEVLYGIDNVEQDEDGRCLTAEYEDFFLVNVYVPNAGRKLVTLDKRMHWNDVFKNFIVELEKKKPVIVCGDLNVAHQEIDLKNPKTNTKNAGFTKEERDGLTDFLEQGFIDTFRDMYPDKKDAYTFWTYMSNSRQKNVGWRIDYFLVSNSLKEKVCEHSILDQVFGSDHCPITLFISS